MTENVGTSNSKTAPRPQRRGGLDGPLGRAAAMLAWGPGGIRSPVALWAANVLALAGAALIVVSAIIHLYLWDTGYRDISVIGPLFLAQGVVGILFAAVAGVVRWLGLLNLLPGGMREALDRCRAGCLAGGRRRGVYLAGA